MKRILIMGKNSYIGSSLYNYLSKWPDCYATDIISLRDQKWKRNNFSGYDCVFYAVGIAHSDFGKLSDVQKASYYAVNRDLTIQAASRVKADGVKQFIFMSSIIVYGDSAPIGVQKNITIDTPLNPFNYYGDSKVQAERGLLSLADDHFKVVIIRSPMVYGPGCKGNYAVLSRFARRSPVFFQVDNARSMLYIDNLCEFTRLCVEYIFSGIYFPQNKQYVNTSSLVRLISKAHGKRIVFLGSISLLLKALSKGLPMISKVFGNMTIDRSLSECGYEYCIYNLEDSISISEKM